MTQPGKIAVLTDSNCDLPQQYFKKYPIFRLPLVVTCGGKDYRDGIDITVEEIYRDNEYDHWFTAQQALQYGFVDKIVPTPDTINAD